MKYFSVLCIFVIFALAACYAANAEPSQLDVADASLAEKKTEKRGIYGFGYGHGGYGHGFGGYGGYYGHGIGYPHYGGYHHGFAAPYYGGHGYYHHGLYH
ncbi:uncharacterized protein LOC106087565 [Stomoxys calcitrans]|uniref:Uncharacterized protein n=1 Tax=Stomoxys calcitrans TaxID=35570 RepID=A0A1I8PVW4_STOCA|nr:uncharacterized protein LOC106087565 [Stomoxys calcitrans]